MCIFVLAHLFGKSRAKLSVLRRIVPGRRTTLALHHAKRPLRYAARDFVRAVRGGRLPWRRLARSMLGARQAQVAKHLLGSQAG
jgi:hypothetical protein